MTTTEPTTPEIPAWLNLDALCLTSYGRTSSR